MGRKHFAIVDIETTGGLVKRDRMTEVAIVLSDGEEILDEYSTLINPGRSIPPFITKITGIDDDMVRDAPFFHEVAREIVEWTEGQIFVAHNVRFDYGFIRHAFAELGYPFNRQRMCTVQMARRLLQLPSHSLENLIRHYNIEVDHRHRALDNARAAAFVLHQLLTMDGSDRHINHQISRGVRESLLPGNVSIEDLHSLPEDPGVYYFYDVGGTVIYVGKSNNIQKRVMSHFTKTTRKAELLQKKIDRIEHRLTGSDLLAQIVEAREIKTLQPELNRAQRQKRFDTYIATSINPLGYRRFDVIRKPREDNTILNAYTGPKAAKSVLAMLVSEYGLCPIYSGLEIGMGPCSNHQFDTCLGACIHEEAAEDYNIRAEQALERINNRFSEDFLIVGEGRTPDERSVVAVVDGQYYGHTYLDRDSQALNPDDLLGSISEDQYYPEINNMIRKEISKGRSKVIPLNVHTQ